MKDVLAQQKPLVVALRSHLSLPVAVGVSAAIALSGSSLAAAYPVDEPFRERPGSDHSATHRELLFVDPFVADPEQLLIALRPNVETIILDADRGGLEQITEALEQRRDVKAIHIVAHGEAGSLNLAGTTLTEASLSGASELLEGWFTDQPERPEILLYACDLARGPEGLAFVERLSSLAGADVAASTDLTGQGGDWELEYHLGEIATASAFNKGLIKGWSHTLATFTVTNTNDSGAGSLRQAIIDANAAAGEDTITFDAAVTGTITLTSGELEVTDAVVITGPGANSLAISGNNASRIFKSSGSNLTVTGVTLRDGYAPAVAGSRDGGAIQFYGVGGYDLVLQDVVITENSAHDDGGGIKVDGAFRVVIEDSILSDNRATGNYSDNGDGGAAIIESADYVYVRRSSFTGNFAQDDGGAIEIDEADFVEIEDSTFSDNVAEEISNASGGAINIEDSSYVRIVDSTISGNSSGEDGGGIELQNLGYAKIINTTITDNTAYDDGGGLLVDDASYFTYIYNSTISNNEAGDNGGGLGTYIYYANLFIANSVISDNVAGGYGGGINAYLGDDGDEYVIRVSGSTVSGNSAGRSGGGINIYADDEGQTVYIENSVIRNNTAGTVGGGLSFYGDDSMPVTITGSTISENTANYDGGGVWLYSDDGTFTVINSTISHNQSINGAGGGIFVDYAEDVYLFNSTIAFNTSKNYGSGISMDDSGDLFIANSIVSENTATESGDDLHTQSGGSTSVYYSLIGTYNEGLGCGVIDCNNVVTSDSGLHTELLDLGGVTPVLPLTGGSPAINAGKDGFASLATDQRGAGFPRVQGGRLDIGAFETTDSNSNFVPDWEEQGQSIPVPSMPNWLLAVCSMLLALLGISSARGRARRED